jgi:RNA polymerase sigma-70 factor (ECF subfamily)
MDERTFARVAEEYAGRLYAVAYRMLGHRADAEDAVQRALTKCFAARATYSPRWAVSTWLYRALSNVCIDDLRRRRPQAALGEADAATPAARGVERVDLARALDAVPREARLLMALHYVDGLSYRELAAVRGISVNTVKSQLARGKAIVKRALEQ